MNPLCAKNWEIIADNLKKAGWNCGCISSTHDEGRQFWVAAAEREDTGRFIVRADEKLTAFVELEWAIRNGQRLAAAALVLCLLNFFVARMTQFL